MSLEPGTRSYNFACQVPINCPSSFEGTHGRIRYMVDVNIIQPWKYDSVFSRAFTVIQVMDIGTYESVSQVGLYIYYITVKIFLSSVMYNLFIFR